MAAKASHRTFRFFNHREKYLLFTTTCSEKQETAKRIAAEFNHLIPVPPALKVFQVGSGEGTLLNRVLRHMHYQWPNVPLLVVVKESSAEFIRMAVRNLADRFAEHPHTVLVFTNVRYADGPWNAPTRAWTAERLNWREVALEGTSSQGFDAQINRELPFINDGWETAINPTTGNPVSVRPSAMILFRADQHFALSDVIPRRGHGKLTYDLVMASNPYRVSLSAREKVSTLLAPLARSLAPGGRLITVQATGRDPGMEIIREIWPEEDPFHTPRETLVESLRTALERSASTYTYPVLAESEAEFCYRLQLNPDEVESNIGTSTLLAAWNAATYVAQIEDARLTDAMRHGQYLEASSAVLHRHHGLWFRNECFVVTRPRAGGASEGT